VGQLSFLLRSPTARKPWLLILLKIDGEPLREPEGVVHRLDGAAVRSVAAAADDAAAADLGDHLGYR
jgi:hypothetical protein